MSMQKIKAYFIALFLFLLSLLYFCSAQSYLSNSNHECKDYIHIWQLEDINNKVYCPSGMKLELSNYNNNIYMCKCK